MTQTGGRGGRIIKASEMGRLKGTFEEEEAETRTRNTNEIYDTKSLPPNVEPLF